MNKVAVITDTHFGAMNDSSSLAKSMAKFYSQIFFPTLDKHSISTVLHLGDFGDRRKYINFETARFIEDTYRAPLRQRGIAEYVLIGNHDCYFKHSTNVNSIEELCRHDGTVTVIKHPVELELCGHTMLFLPWICDENQEASMRLIRESKASLVLGHLQLTGFQMYRGMPCDEDGLNPSDFDRFQLVLSGHFHHKSTRGPVNYLGAPYPMMWLDYKDPRGFHLLDLDRMQVEFIENPYTIFARLVYDDEGKKFDYIEGLVQKITAPESEFHEARIKVVVKTKTQPYWFELLMDALYKVNAIDVVVQDDIVVNDDESESRTEDDLKSVDTLSVMTEYIDTLQISADKNELKQYLRGLYGEAVAADQSARLS